jgi:hypothetical protein
MATRNTLMKYDTNRIIGDYGLKFNHQCSFLDKLLDITINTENENLPLIETYRQRIEHQGAFWNEEELKMKFLALVFDYANVIEESKIELFYERTLSTELAGVKQSVVCDCLLASPYGIYEPKIPYFFLQEFKKQKQNEDAEGQMLLAMLIAQKLNSNGNPLYGCFIQGRYWIFSVLHENNYCISRTYEITQKNDILSIIFILRNLKQIILRDLV